MRKVNFLEVVIGHKRIKMEEEKVKTVINWLVSKLVMEVQKFLELANYYRRFLKIFTKIVRPLHELTKKKQKWE